MLLDVSTAAILFILVASFIEESSLIDLNAAVPKRRKTFFRSGADNDSCSYYPLLFFYMS